MKQTTGRQFRAKQYFCRSVDSAPHPVKKRFYLTKACLSPVFAKYNGRAHSVKRNGSAQKAECLPVRARTQTGIRLPARKRA